MATLLHSLGPKPAAVHALPPMLGYLGCYCCLLIAFSEIALGVVFFSGFMNVVDLVSST